MRIFVAGATGAIGRRLVPLLVSGGHHVAATTRTPDKMDGLRAIGADAVLMDGLDKQDVLKAVAAIRPEVIVHQMTAIGSLKDLKRFDNEMAPTNQLRMEGTRHLCAAAALVGAKLVAQSFTGWPNQRTGGRVKSESDPLDVRPPAAMTQTLRALQALEKAVSDSNGIILRYGSFYGPGTSISTEGEIVAAVRDRMLPLVGGGTGVWSFIHVDDAAQATQLAIVRGAPGVYNIVDDEPAEVATWLPELARAVGAKPPRRVPAWIARLMIGEAGVSMMTEIRGSSNAKARQALGWQPRYATWRDGFARGLAAELENRAVLV